MYIIQRRRQLSGQLISCVNKRGIVALGGGQHGTDFGQSRIPSVVAPQIREVQ